jgi:hypothetical protein
MAYRRPEPRTLSHVVRAVQVVRLERRQHAVHSLRRVRQKPLIPAQRTRRPVRIDSMTGERQTKVHWATRCTTRVRAVEASTVVNEHEHRGYRSS